MAPRLIVMVTVAMAVLGACQPTADEWDCVDRWNEAIGAGKVTAPSAADIAWMDHQHAWQWEGDTPMCWLAVSADARCHSFSFDIDGRWLPPGWVEGETAPGACFGSAPDALELAIDSGGRLVAP